MTQDVSSRVAPRLPLIWESATLTMDVSISSIMAAPITVNNSMFLLNAFIIPCINCLESFGGRRQRQPIDQFRISYMDLVVIIRQCSQQLFCHLAGRDAFFAALLPGKFRFYQLGS